MYFYNEFTLMEYLAQSELQGTDGIIQPTGILLELAGVSFALITYLSQSLL